MTITAMSNEMLTDLLRCLPQEGCQICHLRPVNAKVDPRMPLLQLELCDSCKDVLARMAGWEPPVERGTSKRLFRQRTVWTRDGVRPPGGHEALYA